MKKRTKLYRASVALTIATIALASAGCAAQSGSGDSKTTLTVYGWKGGGTELANVAEINAAFEKSHPDIKLDYQYLAAGDAYAQKLNSELLAGTGPDVFMNTGFKELSASGYLADLSDEPWAASVLDEVKPFLKADDKIYAAPMEIVGITTYANMDLLAQAGITEVPTTKSEFESDMAALKSAGIDPLSLPNKAGWTAQATLQQIASTLVYSEDADWDQKFVDGDTTFADTAGWVDSVDQLEELDSKGYVSWKDELGIDEWSQGLADVKAGKSAFWVQGAWNLAGVADAGINAQVFPWPASDTVANKGTFFVGTSWSVNAASDSSDAAKEYVDFWSTPANALPFLEAENAISPFEGGENPTSDATAVLNAAYKAGDYRILPGDTWLYGVEGDLSQQVQSFLLVQIDTKGLLNQYQEFGEKALKLSAE